MLIIIVQTFLVGASGGVYALIAAHLANVILNWGEMPFNWVRLLSLMALMGTDVGVFIYNTYVKVEQANRVSFIYITNMGSSLQIQHAQGEW